MKEWNQLLRHEEFPYGKHDQMLLKNRQVAEVQVWHHNFSLYSMSSEAKPADGLELTEKFMYRLKSTTDFTSNTS